jgi:hypothetical protein
VSKGKRGRTQLPYWAAMPTALGPDESGRFAL